MMKRIKTGMASITTSTLMLAISMAVVGCGGGGGGSSSSGTASGAEDSNNGGTSPQPVTCSETQYLHEGSCKNKVAQGFEPLQIHRFLKGQAYQLNLKTDQDLALSFSSQSPKICDFEQGELKALDLGKCTLTLTQAGTSQLLPVNSTMVVDVIEAHAEEHKDLNACHAGRPSEAERQLFINTLNEIRALHHLPKVRYDNISYGLLANNLQFHFSAMQYNVIYDVNVKNVLVDGKAEDYAYWFKVDDQSSEQRSSGESSNEI
ncbi:MAG: hypothetical protein A3F63_15795 [Pseudomonadales bacterium RIFCSPHIGHO2_12_FULL_40_16]|nr:MAG: hypothetical protein A3F63_15795 [Pseudomonadales bacterium RIFCSPHIGHO2_12_FULL_40_16]